MAGVAAGVLLVALLAPRTCGPDAPAKRSPRPVEQPDPERERRAEDILNRARYAVSRGQWEQAQRLLDELTGQFGDTTLRAVEAPTLGRLRGRIAAGLAAPPPAQPPVSTIEAARARWPAAFEDPLSAKSCRDRAWLCKGQYGGRFDIHQGALVIAGCHTTSAAWWRQLVGASFLLSVEMKIVAGTPFICLGGPGYGTHAAMGSVLRLTPEGDRLILQFLRQGRPAGLPLSLHPYQKGGWFRLDVLRRDGALSLAIDGQPLGQCSDGEALGGPVHAFIGFGVEKGLFGSNGVWFRNLSIRMPEVVLADVVERVFDPAPSVEPAANGRVVAVDDFGQDGVSRWTATQRADAFRKRGDSVALHGSNAWPRAWRNEPVSVDIALELDMAYLAHCEALNFQVRLRLGEFIGAKGEAFRGWDLYYPTGDGRIVLEWRDREGKGMPVASTSYFAPVPGRRYILRFEKSRRRLRVFVNGRFLLEGATPSDIPRDVAVTPGLYQIYGGSSARTLSVWEIAPLPEPGLDAPTPQRPMDVGPRLAGAVGRVP
ncbi:hypothetical protein HQ560_19550 [bacterium]|nr:hypothetical protein [bacterium]